ASFAVVNGTPTLTLDGVNVNEGYPLDVIAVGLLCSDELTIVLADGSDNNITISGTYAMGIMTGDMSYFSPLTVTGTGTLTVSASASGMLCFGGYVGGIQVTGGAEFTVTASTPVAQAECIGLNIDVGGNLQVSDGGVVRISGTTAAAAFGDDTVQILADGYSIQGSTTANDFTNLADAELGEINSTPTFVIGEEFAKSVVIAPAHSHTWAGAWTTDATHHWHKCTADGCPVTDDTQKDGYALHIYNDVQDVRCSVCAYVRHYHTWSRFWTTDDTHHWHKCTAPGCPVTDLDRKNGYAPHSGGTATCTAKAVCDACAIPYGELAAHNFTGDYLSDADGHWHKCKTCTATDTKAAHAYDNDQDTTCNTCGYTRTITPSHTHTWAGAWTTNETHHWHECTAPGCPVTDPAQKDDYAVHEEDSGTVTKPVTETETGVKTFKCTVCGRVLRTEDIPIPTYSISGLVEDKDGAAVSGAAVTLMRGSRQIGQTTTDPSGQYTFPNVPAGTYNVVAEQGTGDDKITKTILVVLADSNATSQNIKMPDGKKNSVVEVKSGAPDVVVGGVDQVAEAQDVGSGQTVTIKLTVEKKEENTATGAADIKQLAGGKTVDFLELSLVKEVTGGTNDGITSITDTLDNVLEIVVPYDFSGKNAVTVYRHHDGKAQALTPADTNARGTFRLDETGGLIYIYATKFSTYAIGYTPSGVTPPTPPSGGSDSPDTYTPIIEKSGHGKVECRPRSPERGEKVTLTLTPDKGWQLGSLTVTDRNGKPVVVTRRGDGIYTFTQPTGKATIKAVFQPISVTPSSCLRDSTCPIWPFQDSDPGAWYHDGVHYCIEKEWMVGSDSHTFSPDGHMSRAMIASILWRMEGRPVVNYILPFDDVAQSAWHAEAVRWAAANGVAGGYGDGCFGPDDPITREQLSLMLWRYAGSPTPAEELKAFSDAHTAGDWARDALCWAVEKGILTGRGDGVLDPGGNATRAEAAVMLLRYSQRGQ
ncbi:MAG: hypothetical protein HFF07_05540, partial [Oscillospiraceae bacterium]|nr:hypothetical protein [Oscillospiraceae bacterium]